MSRKRKRKKHEEHVDESWLLPYADLLTLLLALFIVLLQAARLMRRSSIRFLILSAVSFMAVKGYWIPIRT